MIITTTTVIRVMNITTSQFHSRMFSAYQPMPPVPTKPSTAAERVLDLVQAERREGGERLGEDAVAVLLQPVGAYRRQAAAGDLSTASCPSA